MNKKFTHAYLKKGSIDEKNFTIDFIMTIETEDRHGDIVDVDTIKTENFMKNPVVLPAHDHSAKAVGKVVEINRELVDGKKALVGKVQFAVNEYDLAKTYWNLYKGGFMNAVSIGFIPESGKVVGDVFILYGADIIELSLVAVPANQLALAKQKGIEIDSIISNMDESGKLKEFKEFMLEAKTFIDLSEEDKKKVEEDFTKETENEVKEEVKKVETKQVKKKKKLSTLLAKAIRELNK
jgi:hypothetical protein